MIQCKWLHTDLFCMKSFLMCHLMDDDDAYEMYEKRNLNACLLLTICFFVAFAFMNLHENDFNVISCAKWMWSWYRSIYLIWKSINHDSFDQRKTIKSSVSDSCAPFHCSCYCKANFIADHFMAPKREFQT